MMTPASLYNALSGNAGLAALVSDRIYPVQAPQDAAAPYVIWSRISSQPFTTHSEAALNQDDLVQFSCFAADFDAADAVANALIAALDNVALSTGDSPTLQSRRDMGNEDAVELYRVDADFVI